MAWHDWIGDKWGEFVLARPWRKENVEKAVASPANPFKAENWRPREGYFTPKTPTQAIRDVNNRAAGRQGGYFNPPPPPRFRPEDATPATQRYLRSVGWSGPATGMGDQSVAEFGVDEASMVKYGAHKYKLTPWQMQQAELDYGFKAKDEAETLVGNTWSAGAMSQEAFDKLTPQQQNAVRFNALLTQAVESDRKAALAGAVGDEEYNNRVKEMFGTQGGSKVYAPATMSLLEKSGMGRLRGQDLDEYLSLDRAFDVSEIRNLQPWDAPEGEFDVSGFANARSAASAAQLDRRQIDRAGEFMAQALAAGNWDTYSWDENSRIQKALGLTLDPAMTPIGWLIGPDAEKIAELRGVDADKEIYFQTMYSRLSDPNDATALDDFWIDTEGLEFTDQDYDEIFNYFNARSLEDDRMGAQEGLRTGQQVRDYIGIG